MGIGLVGNHGLIVNNGSVTTGLSNIIGGIGVYIIGDVGDTNQLVNNGVISASLYAVGGGKGIETIINHGAMIGNIALSGGADLFKGWGGTVDGDIHGGGGNDTLIGGASDDVIFGERGNDVLKGANGDDTLTGGAGRDNMTGGAGADTFDFNAIGETTVGALRDRIADFSKGEDVIDLATIDAMTGAGNQVFDFIGTTGFSGIKGELRAANASGNTIVAGDTDGDGSADFQILLVGVTGLTEGDFVL